MEFIADQWIYAYLFVSTFVWDLFSLLVMLKCIKSARKFWSEFRRWVGKEDGIELTAKQIISEDHFKVSLWHSIASGGLLLIALIATRNLLFDDLPSPEYVLNSAFIRNLFLGFIFCFYMAERANVRTNSRLDELREASEREHQGDE